MKAAFGFVFVVLLGLTLYAIWLQRDQTTGDKLPLVWVSDDNPVRQGQIALFNQLHPEFDLELDPNNTGMEKVIVQSLAGVGPDLFDCYDGFQLSAYVRSGIAWDVTDQLQAAGIDTLNEVWKAVYPNILCDGRVYGFPTNAAANAIWYNKDIFDQEGIPYPHGSWTWDEFVRLAQRLTKYDDNGRPVYFGLLCDWWNWSQFILQWGGRIYSADGTRCVIDSPEAIAGVQFLHDLIYKYKVMPSPVQEAAMATSGGWGSGTITLFGGGKGAMALGGRWWLCTLRTYEGLHLGAVECPHGPVHVFRGYGRATLVNAQSPRREQALRFLEYEAGQAYNELVNAQADALGGVKRFAYTDLYLHDPAHPEEDYNAVWRDIMDRAEPNEVSPFVNGQRAQTILNKQLDLVKSDDKPAADALQTAAEQINQEIEKTLEQDPVLRLRYQRLQREAAKP